MRYFTFDEFDDKGGNVVTLSEDTIRKEYYPYWYGRMCDKFGKDYVDKNYDFESCLIDWQIVHGAWEISLAKTIERFNNSRGLLWTEEDKEEFATIIIRECNNILGPSGDHSVKENQLTDLSNYFNIVL